MSHIPSSFTLNTPKNEVNIPQQPWDSISITKCSYDFQTVKGCQTPLLKLYIQSLASPSSLETWSFWTNNSLQDLRERQLLTDLVFLKGVMEDT